MNKYTLYIYAYIMYKTKQLSIVISADVKIVLQILS